MVACCDAQARDEVIYDGEEGSLPFEWGPPGAEETDDGDVDNESHV